MGSIHSKKIVLRPQPLGEKPQMKLPTPSDFTARYAGVVVGAANVLFLLLHVVFDWETAPRVLQVIFSVAMGIPLLLYTFSPKFFRPFFPDGATWETERLATMSRMKRFLVGWFSVCIPGLLILQFLVRPAME